MKSHSNNVTPIISLLARNVKQRRTELALTQEGLAELSGLSHNYVARIELGMRKPSIESLVALADALDTSVADLFAPEHPQNEAAVRTTHYVESLIQNLSPEDQELITGVMTALVRRLRTEG